MLLLARICSGPPPSLRGLSALGSLGAHRAAFVLLAPSGLAASTPFTAGLTAHTILLKWPTFEGEMRWHLHLFYPPRPPSFSALLPAAIRIGLTHFLSMPLLGVIFCGGFTALGNRRPNRSGATQSFEHTIFVAMPLWARCSPHCSRQTDHPCASSG